MERLTSTEAAAELDVHKDDAITLLRAARVPHKRLGANRMGPYLWQAQAVRNLREFLDTNKGRGNDNED